jgi:hypothetical protein
MNNTSENLNIELTPWNDLPSHCQKGMVEIVTKILTRQLFDDWQLTRRFNSLGTNISFEEFAAQRILNAR